MRLKGVGARLADQGERLEAGGNGGKGKGNGKEGQLRLGQLEGNGRSSRTRNVNMVG
jgi:hypothetical protein